MVLLLISLYLNTLRVVIVKVVETLSNFSFSSVEGKFFCVIVVIKSPVFFRRKTCGEIVHKNYRIFIR